MLNARVELSSPAAARITIRHSQCAWCGLVLDGPLADRRLPLISSYTHGACGPCRRAWVASYETRQTPTAQ